MWFLIIGLALPVVLGIVISVSGMITGTYNSNPYWHYFFIIDPFWGLATNFLYAMLFSLTYPNDWNPLMVEQSKYKYFSMTEIINPWASILIMLCTGAVFFGLTVGLDMFIVYKYRKKDGRELHIGTNITL